ncbi:FKBP-type peptidyl-prolyl cis-trans isomerase [Natronobiforma cellulositropha]|uniref:FKBP-type peptidyl-prolyl cis-trans isomerase n=1 Tax=Natronobiforma cellulositropha TaxID=1679076 RepID=UPI0021D5E902|nr:peptidylprolyl isomerase [Natronobiforma cellulositropha]
MTEEQEAELEAQADDADEEPTDAPESDADETETEEEEGLGAGDFVKLDYTARTVEGEQLVDTTDPAVAEEEGVDTGDREFAPRTVVLGEGHIFAAVEEDISGTEVGESGSVTIPAAEAFGEYDSSAVETISVEKIDEDDRYPGAHVHVNGQHGNIVTILGSRARVDFNHPLAGEDVEYDYEVLDIVDDREERAAGLLGMYLDVEPELWIQTDQVEEEVLVENDEEDDESEEADADAEDEDAEPEYETVTVDKETLYIESTPQLAMNQQWMFSKQQIAQDIMGKVDVERVIVQEVIEGMPAGMPGMMGGMGGAGGAGLEDALEDADIDADEIVEELEADIGDDE